MNATRWYGYSGEHTGEVCLLLYMGPAEWDAALRKAAAEGITPDQLIERAIMAEIKDRMDYVAPRRDDA